MEIVYEDEFGDPILPHDLPGYLGMIWDGELDLSGSLGRLADFGWDDYYYLFDELGIADRKVIFDIQNRTFEVEIEPWCTQVVLDSLPCIVAIDDCPSDQGPASGSGYIFLKADGFTGSDVLHQANKLCDALIADFVVLQAKDGNPDQ